MDLTFHVVFMPGTVRYLRLAILSLLKHSAYRYRLVANGLERSELRQLHDFCALSDRLLFFPYPVKSPVPHGVLLSILQSREIGSYFCFMDSDIFAADPFQAELETHLHACDVFSSCEPLRLDDSESTTGYAGRCLQTPSGAPLATTYFAVYRNELLRRVITETQIGFAPYYFPEQYPREVRGLLAQLGAADIVTADTGKLLNVLSHAYGLRYRYAPIDALMHIGGITKAFAKTGWMKEWLARFLKWPYVLRDVDLEPRTRLFRWVDPPGADAAACLDSEWNRRRTRLRRRRIALFFGFLLKSMIDGTPEPVLDLRDTALADRISRLGAVIRSVRDEYRSALAA